MNYCNIKPRDIADGVGVRVTLFVSGCRNHCKNCFQPETWDFNYGAPFTREVEDRILEELRPDFVDGLTLLGGEPGEAENQRGQLRFLIRPSGAIPASPGRCSPGRSPPGAGARSQTNSSPCWMCWWTAPLWRSFTTSPSASGAQATSGSLTYPPHGRQGRSFSGTPESFSLTFPFSWGTIDPNHHGRSRLHAVFQQRPLYLLQLPSH